MAAIVSRGRQGGLAHRPGRRARTGVRPGSAAPILPCRCGRGLRCRRGPGGAGGPDSRLACADRGGGWLE
jgi:hypothetical protein